jgi:hypothetical protein
MGRAKPLTITRLSQMNGAPRSIKINQLEPWVTDGYSLGETSGKISAHASCQKDIARSGPLNGADIYVVRRARDRLLAHECGGMGPMPHQASRKQRRGLTRLCVSRSCGRHSASCEREGCCGGTGRTFLSPSFLLIVYDVHVARLSDRCESRSHASHAGRLSSGTAALFAAGSRPERAS